MLLFHRAPGLSNTTHPLIRHHRGRAAAAADEAKGVDGTITRTVFGDVLPVRTAALAAEREAALDRMEEEVEARWERRMERVAREVERDVRGGGSGWSSDEGSVEGV